jgi:hypothetical protein
MTNSLSQRVCGELFISKNATISIEDHDYHPQIQLINIETCGCDDEISVTIIYSL